MTSIVVQIDSNDGVWGATRQLELVPVRGYSGSLSEAVAYVRAAGSDREMRIRLAQMTPAPLDPSDSVSRYLAEIISSSNDPLKRGGELLTQITNTITEAIRAAEATEVSETERKTAS